MKLNPVSKKSNPYLDKIKSENDALNLELTPLKAELAEAEAEHAAAREKQNRLRDAAGSLSMNTPPAAKAHWPILCEANQRMERLKSKLSNLESQLRPLQQVLATPERFAVARKQLDDLIAQRKALTAEGQTVDGQLTKIAKRLANLEARIAVETKSASRALLDTEAEFVVPETLTKLEVELRITRASQVELERQRDAIQGQLAGLPDAVRKARDHFIHCRAAMAEIELHEQLMPVMNALARASAARRQINYHHDESRFPVDRSCQRCTGGRNASALTVTRPAHRRIGSFLAIKQYGGRERATSPATDLDTGLPAQVTGYHPISRTRYEHQPFHLHPWPAIGRLRP